MFKLQKHAWTYLAVMAALFLLSLPVTAPVPVPSPAGPDAAVSRNASSQASGASRAPSSAPPTEPATIATTATTPKTTPVFSTFIAPDNTEHPNIPYEALLTPNDPSYPSQWNLPRLDAPAAWDMTTGSASVTVAVIDSGFGLSHEDLAGQWALNSGESGAGRETNGLDDDGNGYIDDWRGWDFTLNDNDPSAGAVNPSGSGVSHGTLVAGIIAAKQNNGKGISGIAPGVKILPLQALSDEGSGYTSTVAAAIRYAADRGAKVINLSLGSQYADSYLRAQIAYAISRGATVVAAAGNTSCDCLIYPANYPEVIAVGASGSGDTLASFSSYGANLDVLAPGTDGICSTLWTSANQSSAYSCAYQGTSFSAPHVSAAAALFISRANSATSNDVMRFIQAGVFRPAPMGANVRTNGYGFGRVWLYSSLLNAAYGAPAGEILTARQAAGATDQPVNFDAVCKAAAGQVCSVWAISDSQTLHIGNSTADITRTANLYFDATDLPAGSWRIVAVSDGYVVSDFLLVN